MHGDWLSASGDRKNAHLLQLDGTSESLLLFKADVLDRDALAAAVAGCEGVFHVASPVPADKVLDPEASFGPISSD
jgi:nucleoside-diphosphate-sugar epimerase